MSPASILVVESDRGMLASLCEILEGAGYSVRSTHDGAEAVLRLTESRFNLVVMDYRTPRIGGEELVRIIRDNWPEAALIVSCEIPSEVEPSLLRLGVSKVVQRPYVVDDLVRLIGCFLEGSDETTISML